MKNKKRKERKKKKITVIVLIIFIISIMLFIILKNNTSKNIKIGNNTSSQEIVDYILNINSYETIVEVNIKSNKNENKYKIKQIYNEEKENSQEVLEPENIAGLKIIKERNDLKLENSMLNLISILQNYEYISENALDLSCFIEDYKKNNNSSYQENDNQVLMKTSNKTLYINKKDIKPEKMEISDNNKKIAVYILYKEVIVNSK